MSTSDHDPDAGPGPERSPLSPHGPRPDAPALAVETSVVEDRGRWAVEIVVIFPDEAIRRRVNSYPSRRQAEIAASWVKRAAQRDIEGPIHG